MSANNLIAVYRLFSTEYVTNYAAFATARWAQLDVIKPKDYASLEAIHDNMHVYSGGFPTSPSGPFYAGHMAHIPGKFIRSTYRRDVSIDSNMLT